MESVMAGSANRRQAGSSWMARLPMTSGKSSRPGRKAAGIPRPHRCRLPARGGGKARLGGQQPKGLTGVQARFADGCPACTAAASAPDTTGPSPGRPGRIDPKLRGRAPDAVDGQPEGRGTKPNVRTGRLILIMLSGAFGVNGIPPGTACRTAHGMGRSYKKPGRPLGRRAPSGEAKEEFEADPGRKIASAAAGFGVFWVYESRFSTRTIRGMTLTRGLSIPHRIKPYGKVFYHILSKREPPLSIPHRIKPYGKRCTRFAVPRRRRFAPQILRSGQRRTHDGVRHKRLRGMRQDCPNGRRLPPQVQGDDGAQKV